MNTFILAILVVATALLPLLALLALGRASDHRPAERMLLTIGSAVVLVGWSWWQFERGENAEIAARIVMHEEDPRGAMRSLADSLERRLAAGDSVSVDKLVLLARTHEAAGDLDRAARIYARANEQTEFDNANLLVAEVEARLNDARLDAASQDIARERLAQALAISPEHPGANYYAGAMALREGRMRAALPHLEVVLRSGILSDDAQELLESRVAQLRGGGEAGAASDAPALVPAMPADVDAADLLIEVHAESGVPSGDGTLFVFLRVPDGPPMPLAARRVERPEFPLRVRVRDSDRLWGDAPLRSHERLTLGVRLSSSGEAAGHPGDPFAQTEIVPAESAEASLLLRR